MNFGAPPMMGPSAIAIGGYYTIREAVGLLQHGLSEVTVDLADGISSAEARIIIDPIMDVASPIGALIGLNILVG